MMTLEDKEKIEKLSKILTSNNYPFRKTIKLYILKVINDLYCKDYNEFKHFYYEDIGIKWIDEFDIYTPDIKFLNFLFLDINNIEDYLILKREINFTHFKTQSQQIISLINNKGFMTLFNLILNEYVSKISDKEFQNKKYKEFTLNFNQKISLFSELTENSKRILSQFLDYYKYRINPIFDYLSSNEEIEILLFAYKFAFICSLSNEDSFYYKLTSQNIENIINTNYIPGGEPNDDLIIQNANQVERHLIETNNTSPGAYVCSCGYFYTIGECSLPTVISPCPICGEKIGGLDHKLVERNNHFRVFKNQQQFDELSKRSYYKSLNYMLLSDFKVMIEQKKKQDYIGVNIFDKAFFEKRDKDVRNLNKISYRILSFIFYSCIYFSEIRNMQKFTCVRDKKRKNFMDVIDMLKINWEILNKDLSDKGINSIQIYLNMIFPSIAQIIKKSAPMNRKENRKSFEEEINNFIESSFSNYGKFYYEFIKINSQITEKEGNELKSLIYETFNSKSIINKNFPYYEYFLLSKIPSLIELENYIENNNLKNKYPVTSSFLKYYNSEGIKNLKNLNKLNQFEMFMLNRHSYNLTRIEAKKKTIKEDLEAINDKNVNKMYDEFEIGFNNLSHYIFDTDFVCHVNLQNNQVEKKINKNDVLAYCLNDRGEVNYGIYLAVYYHELIKVQNGFLNLIENYLNHIEIKNLKETISNVIYIQKASPYDIIDLDVKNKLFNNPEQLIFSFTYRDCFDVKNNKINYLNYKNVKYNLDKIEVELGKIILPGKKKFNTEQIYVTYGFEGYNGNNSTIMANFKEKYKQEHLNKSQKNALSESIKAKDYKNILFSIEMLFYYLVNGGNANYNDSLKDFIENLPKFIVVKKDLIQVFTENPSFKIKHLVYIYEYTEKEKCQNIFETIEELYKMRIDQNMKKKIVDYQDKNKLVKKDILADVVRKFISRFLSGNRTEREINDNTPILDWLQPKEELWPDSILREQNKFDKEMSLLSLLFPVLVSQSIDFYYTLKAKKV